MYFKILTKDMEAPFNKEFFYKLNKKYIIDNNEPIESYKNGFHYFNNTDIISIYFKESCFFNDKYRIFEVKPEGDILEDSYRLCCSEITLIKELSFEDLIDYDKTGKYTYYYSLCNNNKKIDISKFEDAVIEKDNYCKWCYNFAQYVKGANIDKLEDAIIKKDITGYYCYNLALNIKGVNVNIKKLKDAVIEKDITGEYRYLFAKNVKDADIKKLEVTVIEKDDCGKWCFKFAKDVKGANINKLENETIKKDTTGEWYSKFSKYNCY
jgi:hypothetical protein